MFLTILYNIIICPIEIIFDIIFFLFQKNPGVAIIAISLVMNFLALPLYQRADAIQEEERNKVQSMKHWVDHIKKTFKGDERYMKLNEYYRIEGYKPIYALRSMFPLLLQIPFFIAAYHYLSTQPLLGGASFLFLDNLGLPDQLIKIGDVSINVLPILMTLINLISGYIYLRGFPLRDKIQTYGIAVIFLIILYNSPSGLVFYWTLNQIFSVAKNVFMKVVKKQNIRNIIFAIFGVTFVILMAILGQLKTKKIIVITILVFAFCCAPFIISKIKRLIKNKIKPVKPIEAQYFLLGSIFLSLFAGVVIPLSVVNSDPTEFVTKFVTPTSLVINNLCIYLGFFVFWLGIYYYLSKTRVRNGFTIVVWLMSVIFIVNYLFFAGNYGIMSNSFVFDRSLEIAKSEVVLNLFVVLILAIALFFIIKKCPKISFYFYVILIIGCIGISVFYGVNITSTIANSSNESVTTSSITDENVVDQLSFSKNGTNTVVFVVDKAFGGYVPYIFDEKPKLEEKFSGFTYYPNTVSYGTCTKWGAPALYGGYEYSPSAINQREDELLVDKHDESLSVMPAVFSNNDYNVTVWNSVLAGYGNKEKASTLYKFDNNIKTFSLDSKYQDQYYDKYGESIEKARTRNLVQYTLFRVSPLAVRKIIYNHGNYVQTSQAIYSESFLKQYSALLALSEITKINNSSENNFLLLFNALPHTPAQLDEKYEPSENLELSLDVKNQPKILNGEKLKMDTVVQSNAYDVNMASFILIGKWLDYLKQNNVYDNTRIIIASDHGNGDLKGQVEKLYLEDGTDMEGLNCLLMYKDYNSEGNIVINNDFMTNADVPTLATNGTINNLVNPFTGMQINSDDKNNNQVFSNPCDWETNLEDKLFDMSKEHLWTLKNENIFDKDNWQRVQ